MNHVLALTLAASLSLGARLPEACPTPLERPAVGGLCQLTFSGELDEELPGWVSITVTHLVEAEAVETSLVAQLRSGTSAGSVCALLSDRLEAAGARVIPVIHPVLTGGDLFVEDVLSVRLDLPAGPKTSVNFCDRPLGVLGLRATGERAYAGTLKFQGLVTRFDGKERALEELEVPIIAGETGHDVCKRLFDESLDAGWLAVRPKTNQWSPVRRQDSGKLESFGVTLSASGWELVVSAG